MTLILKTKLPADWQVVRLSQCEIFSLENGLWSGKNGNVNDAPRSRAARNYQVKTKVIRNTNFRDRGILSLDDVVEIEVDEKQLKGKLLSIGDILLERSGGGPDQPVGRVVYFDTPSTEYSFSNFTTRIRVLDTEKILPKHLMYYLLYFYYRGGTDSLQQRTTGIRNLDFNGYINFEIPIPPLSEQQKIVYVLDTIQGAIEVQDKIIELTKELKKSMMADLFKYGAPSFRKGRKLKKTEIGEIPEDWEVVRLGKVCFIRKEQILPNENTMYVGLEHLEPGSIKLTRWGKGDEVKSLKNKFYPKDILYGKLRPYLDKAVIAENEGVCSTDLIVIRCSESKVSPFYLINFIHTLQFLNFAISTMNGTNHPRTSWNSLKAFKIPLPSLPEQQEIAEILQTIDEKIELEKKKKELYEELFRAMLNKLMTAEIRVKDVEFSP